MGWYQKLNEYFPEDEMKKKEQLSDLITKNPHYKKEETEEYVVLYAEFRDFIFVDYILVDKKTRGKGIGSTILEELKNKNKNVILEVEPVVEDDPDTVKREHFYLDNGFKKAEHIQYYRDAGETSPKLTEMEIYYWSPDPDIDEEVIHDQMLQAYEDIHNYHYEEYFERETPDAEELVRYDMEGAEDPSDQPRL